MFADIARCIDATTGALADAGRVAVFVLLVTGGATVAAAQETASSFHQLLVLVKPGDAVTVTDSAGRQIRGTITELSSSRLEVTVGGNRRALQEADISLIRHRRADPLDNGAKWGFGIGVAVGLLGVAAAASEVGGSVGWGVPVGLALYGGLGAGIGAGIDATVTKEKVIFARGAGSSARGAQWLLAGHRRMVSITVGF
jgi:hypothetical protein